MKKVIKGVGGSAGGDQDILGEEREFQLLPKTPSWSFIISILLTWKHSPPKGLVEGTKRP
jgi:hypothetical protein